MQKPRHHLPGDLLTFHSTYVPRGTLGTLFAYSIFMPSLSPHSLARFLQAGLLLAIRAHPPARYLSYTPGHTRPHSRIIPAIYRPKRPILHPPDHTRYHTTATLSHPAKTPHTSKFKRGQWAIPRPSKSRNA